MIVTPDIPFINHLFKCLWRTAAHRQTPSSHRLKALGTLSESAVFYYRECDAIVDLVYEQCLALIKDATFSSEAAVILWLMFDYYKGKLGSKKAFKKSTIAFCLETFQLVLEKESNLPDWLSILEFLIFYKIENRRTLYEKYSLRLLRVITDKQEPLYCTAAFNIFMDLFKGCKIKSDIVLNRCLNALRDLTNDAKIPPINQLNAIHSIMAHSPREMEQSFYRLFDFMEGSDIETMFEAWRILFRISSSGLPSLEDMGNQFMQRALNIMNDKNLELGLRLKAIDFMMTSFKQNAYGLTVGEVHAKAYLRLLELVKTEQFLLSDYLESLRLYFKVMNPGAKKTYSLQRFFASANDEGLTLVSS